MSEAKISNSAVISLVLGIFGLAFCGPFLGIPAIILGIVALKKIEREGLDGKGMAIAGITTGSVSFITGIVILAIMAGIFLPAINAAREKARRESCRNDLKMIGLALQQYANDNWDSPSDQSKELNGEPREKNPTDPNVYVCPDSNTTSGKKGE